ncbi:MAG: msrP 1, partial [Microbacterium sp.]|nr:msrP 1 [Microbacterium sp.]
MSTTPKARWMLWAAVSGVISAGAFLAVAELTALIVARGAGPLEAVGAFVIDIVPQPLKEFAISTFGDADKIVLLASLGLAAVIGAAIAGLLEYVRPPLGVVLFGIVTLATGAALVTRAAAGPLDALPAVTGGVAAASTAAAAPTAVSSASRASGSVSAASGSSGSGSSASVSSGSPTERGAATDSGLAPRASAVATDSDSDAPSAPLPGRRTFLTLALVSTVAAAVVGTGSRLISGATSSITAVR